MGKIKGLITDCEIMINRKGVPSYSTQSLHRFVVNINLMETSYDERRFVIIRSNDEECGDSSCLNELNEVIQEILPCSNYFKSLNGLDQFHSERISTTNYQE